MDKKKTLLTLSALAIGSVVYSFLKPIRSKVAVIDNFDLDRYLGHWYEIARLDFLWEKGLKNVTADYHKNDDGSVRVENKGIQIHSGVEKVSIGKAKLNGEANLGSLKVSFFGRSIRVITLSNWMPIINTRWFLATISIICGFSLERQN